MAGQQRDATSNFDINLRARRVILCLVPFLAAGILAVQAQTLTVLHEFTGGSDGSNPYSSLVMDRSGSLYGAAPFGGSQMCETQNGIGCGTVFKLAHKTGGWVFSPLYAFTGYSDGNNPVGSLAIAPDGTIYGTTDGGGLLNCRDTFGDGCGTVFHLQPPPTFCDRSCALGTKLFFINSPAAAMATTHWPELCWMGLVAARRAGEGVRAAEAAAAPQVSAREDPPKLDAHDPVGVAPAGHLGAGPRLDRHARRVDAVESQELPGDQHGVARVDELVLGARPNRDPLMPVRLARVGRELGDARMISSGTLAFIARRPLGMS